MFSGWRKTLRLEHNKSQIVPVVVVASILGLAKLKKIKADQSWYFQTFTESVRCFWKSMTNSPKEITHERTCQIKVRR